MGFRGNRSLRMAAFASEGLESQLDSSSSAKSLWDCALHKSPLRCSQSPPGNTNLCSVLCTSLLKAMRKLSKYFKDQPAQAAHHVDKPRNPKLHIIPRTFASYELYSKLLVSIMFPSRIPYITPFQKFRL